MLFIVTKRDDDAGHPSPHLCGRAHAADAAATDKRPILLARRSSTESAQSGRCCDVLASLTALRPVAGRGGPHLRGGHHAAGAAGDRQAGLPASAAQHHCSRRRRGRGDVQQQRRLAAAGQHPGGRAQRGQRARSATCLCPRVGRCRDLNAHRGKIPRLPPGHISMLPKGDRALWNFPSMSAQLCCYAGQKMVSHSRSTPVGGFKPEEDE